MAIELELNGTTSASARFITYARSPARLRQVAGAGDVQVTISSQPAKTTGGEAVFYAVEGGPSQASLTVSLPATGAWIDFAIGGKWGSASIDRDDCLIVVKSPTATQTFPCMVRLRKNANRLEDRERDRFLAALGSMNASGVYQSFRNIHVGGDANLQEHRGPHFLPWHRAYLLDFERELQRIDPQVTLPYWRFDETAENVFDARFMGETKQVSPSIATPPSVKFVSGHPLSAWVIDSLPGIARGASFNAKTDPAPGVPDPDPSRDFSVISQDLTLALGDVYAEFDAMEGKPHGAAHVSFVGPISVISTAPQDPLFFLLHCNVDRLWALWEWLKRHRLPVDPDAYDQDSAAQKGRKLQDTLWPWDGDKKNGRPKFPPPRIGLPSSDSTTAPGAQPTVGSMIDLDGFGVAQDRLGFGYDTVPFEET
jgi:tyrosinase